MYVTFPFFFLCTLITFHWNSKDLFFSFFHPFPTAPSKDIDCRLNVSWATNGVPIKIYLYWISNFVLNIISRLTSNYIINHIQCCFLSYCWNCKSFSTVVNKNFVKCHHKMHKFELVILVRNKFLRLCIKQEKVSKSTECLHNKSF